MHRFEGEKDRSKAKSNNIQATNKGTAATVRFENEVVRPQCYVLGVVKVAEGGRWRYNKSSFLRNIFAAVSKSRQKKQLRGEENSERRYCYCNKNRQKQNRKTTLILKTRSSSDYAYIELEVCRKCMEQRLEVQFMHKITTKRIQ